MSEITNAAGQPKNRVTDEAMNLMKSYKREKTKTGKKKNASKTKSKTSAKDQDDKSKDKKQRYMFIMGDHITHKLVSSLGTAR